MLTVHKDAQGARGRVAACKVQARRWGTAEEMCGDHASKLGAGNNAEPSRLLCLKLPTTGCTQRAGSAPSCSSVTQRYFEVGRDDSDNFSMALEKIAKH